MSVDHYHSTNGNSSSSTTNFVSSPLCRIHLFPNGLLTRGKCLAFHHHTSSFRDILLQVCAKFNIVIKQQQNIESLPRLFTLKGSEIELVNEIVHDDVLIIVPFGEEFVPPLPLQQVLLVPNYPAQPPSSLGAIDRLPTTAAMSSPHRSSSPSSFMASSSPLPYGRILLHKDYKQPIFINLELIPKDLLVTIFSFLDHKDILCNLALVCQQFYTDYVKSEVLWKELCMNVYLYRRRAMLSAYYERGFMKQKVLDYEDYHDSENDSAVDTEMERQLQISEEDVRQWFDTNMRPPKTSPYRSWRQYFRYYIMWAGALTWDTTERGPNVKFRKNRNNMTVYRDDVITYHWQTVRTNLPIRIPSEESKPVRFKSSRRHSTVLKQQNNLRSESHHSDESEMDDMAVFEWEIVIEQFDRTHNNGWWIVLGLETSQFHYKDSTPTNLVGYDTNMGWGYAGGNGDTLHCYSNSTLKNSQSFTCDPVEPWVNVPYKDGDVIRVRVQYALTRSYESTGAYYALGDAKEHVGASVSFSLNGKSLGQAFRNLTGVVYPATSILTQQSVTLRHVDPIFEATLDTKKTTRR